MQIRYISISTLTVVLFFSTGCISQFVKSPINESIAPELILEIATPNDIAPSSAVSKSSDITPSVAVSDTPVTDDQLSVTPETDTPVSNTLGSETPADTTIYGEEEATLSAILNLYEEAKEALENGDYSHAENRIDSAAVLSSSIDIASIGDESLALRYMNTLASLFQDSGRIYRDVDQINQEDPLNWLDQLSETKPEDFKNGKWTDEELRQIVRRISLRCDMPIEYNDHVKKSISFFQTVEKKTMEKWIRIHPESI